MSKKLKEEFGLKPIKPHKYFTGNQWTKRSYMEWKANENKKAKSSRKSNVKKSSVQAANNSQQKENE